MAGEIEDRGEAQVHWLVAGSFGLGARGKTLTLNRADFNEVLEKRGLSVTAKIPDAVGAGDTIPVTLAIDSLKALTLKHVVSAVPQLAELAKKGEAVAQLKDPTPDAVRGVLGEGKLFEAARALLEGTEAPAAPAPSGAASGDPDAIFEKAAVQEKTAKSAISMFVRATSSAKKSAKPSARQLRDLVEEATWAMAREVLTSPEVRAVEEAWRGVRFLVTQCPKDAKMDVVLLETDEEHLIEDIASRERGEDIDEPECIFIPFEIGATDVLAELADLGEGELIPIVVGVPPSLFGADHPQDLPEAFEALEHARNDELPEWAAKWDELRLRESTRWLCAVANRVALHTEGAGAAARTCFGSGVWGLATMLARSYAASGGFAQIFGKTGSVSAPATHVIKGGRYADTAAPTEAFYAIAPADVLAKNGVLGLGSAKNSDAIVLAKAVCVRGAKDVVPLPAQILTGRIVRFATWVKAQLPEGCNSATANDIFTSAASVFLFPGQEEWAHVRAAVTNIEGEAHVVVHSRANPRVASIPLDISFPLALGWSVPAPEDGGPSAAPKPSAGAVANVAPAKRPDDEGGIASVGLGFDAGLVKKE
ncbi:MAG: type VI secretion system contractile sheath large subunit [Sandaracinaceae bacterium]|nr:type VI secretion system contractile sheath large subunit [Sandaracinaceae bacterium]